MSGQEDDDVWGLLTLSANFRVQDVSGYQIPTGGTHDQFGLVKETSSHSSPLALTQGQCIEHFKPHL